jgi:hypothetical protein
MSHETLTSACSCDIASHSCWMRGPALPFLIWFDQRFAMSKAHLVTWKKQQK